MHSRKMADLIEMLFGKVGRVGPSHHVLDGCSDPLWQGQFFMEMGWRNVMYKKNVELALQNSCTD